MPDCAKCKLPVVRYYNEAARLCGSCNSRARLRADQKDDVRETGKRDNFHQDQI